MYNFITAKILNDKKERRSIEEFFSSHKGFLWHFGTLLARTVPIRGSRGFLTGAVAFRDVLCSCPFT